MSDERTNKPNDDNSSPAAKPDAETLHTTDPQKKMEGPVSSAMHGAGHAFDGKETQEEADKKREDGF